jgi:hypothetical protein
MKFEVSIQEVSIQVPEQRVIDVVINGLETTQWCGVRNYHYAHIERWFEGGNMLDVYNHYEDDEPLQLSKQKLQRGLQLMSEKHPRHLVDIIEECDDATTGDVLLQLALFGEIVYG